MMERYLYMEILAVEGGTAPVGSFILAVEVNQLCGCFGVGDVALFTEKFRSINVVCAVYERQL